MMNPAPMTLANQHWVLTPEGDGSMVAQPVYALSPEAAVEHIRNIFAGAPEFGDMPHAALDKIHLAQGNELPWMQGAHWVIACGNHEVAIHGQSREEVERDYGCIYEGKPFTVRPMTPAEAEESIRHDRLIRDQEDEEQFNYGFNVLYYEMREEC